MGGGEAGRFESHASFGAPKWQLSSSRAMESGWSACPLFCPLTGCPGLRVLCSFVDRSWATVHNAARPWDPPLTERGVLQGRALGERLSTGEVPAPTRIFVSPLGRTVETAAAAARVLGVERLFVEPGLAEVLDEECVPCALQLRCLLTRSSGGTTAGAAPRATRAALCPPARSSGLQKSCAP